MLKLPEILKVTFVETALNGQGLKLQELKALSWFTVCLYKGCDKFPGEKVPPSTKAKAKMILSAGRVQIVKFAFLAVLT